MSEMAFVLPDNQHNQIDSVCQRLKALAALCGNGPEAYKHDVLVNRENLSELFLSEAQQLENALENLVYERR